MLLEMWSQWWVLNSRALASEDSMMCSGMKSSGREKKKKEIQHFVQLSCEGFDEHFITLLIAIKVGALSSWVSLHASGLIENRELK